MCHSEIPAGQPTPDVRSEEVSIPLHTGEHLPALITRPNTGRSPAVLVVCDIHGRSPFYENLARRLAAASFTAICPEYFFREGPLSSDSREAALERRGRLDEEQTLNDLSDCIDWMASQPDVDGNRCGTVGFCMGGTFVLDLASRRKDLATVCYYGFPAGLKSPAGSGVIAAPPLDRVESMSGPIIGFWGEQDAAVGIENVSRFAEEMDSRAVDFTSHIYPDLGHGFLGESQLDPESAIYEAAIDSWSKCLSFLDKHLARDA